MSDIEAVLVFTATLILVFYSITDERLWSGTRKAFCRGRYIRSKPINKKVACQESVLKKFEPSTGFADGSKTFEKDVDYVI